MKTGIEQIVGRRIIGVIVKKSTTLPHEQVFLLFEDGTNYELYGDICLTGGLTKGDASWVCDYMPESHRVVLACLLDAKEQARVQRQVALQQVREQLKSDPVPLPEIRRTLKRAIENGLDWLEIYREAIPSRPVGLSSPPTPEMIWAA